MIKFTILNSILNGELKPWLNNNEQFIDEIEPLYLQASGFTPKTDIELHHQIEILTSPFPALTNYLKQEKREKEITLIPSFYISNVPQHTNTFTAFYYLLFRQETLRIFNRIINTYSEHDTTVRTFLVNRNLHDLKYMAQGITEAIKERGFSHTPDSSEAPVHYALYVARFFEIQLFFEIQEIFEDVVKSPIIPKAFFQTFLKELYNPNYLLAGQAYYENKLMMLIDERTFSYNTIKDLFANLRQAHINNKEAVLAKYENAIFLHSIGENLSQVKSLIANKLIEEFFNSTKSNIQDAINKKELGIDRLEIVNDAINKLYYTVQGTVIHQSIPSLLLQWLSAQKNVYTTAASNIFSVIEKKKDLSKPKKTIGKTQVDEQKVIAYEHLKFMQGVNTQNQSIMSEVEFKQMLTAVNNLIEKDTVPEIKKPLLQIGLPNNFIRYTFYLLHKDLYTTQSIKDSWIDFMHAMFSQFQNTEKRTTKSKFSLKPPMYDTDLQGVKK